MEERKGTGRAKERKSNGLRGEWRKQEKRIVGERGRERGGVKGEDAKEERR